MKVFRFPDNNPPRITPSSVVALGNFDGLHRGHQALFNRALDFASQNGVLSFVFTFDPHPVKILRPETEILPILSMEERAFHLEKLGISGLVIQDFTKDLSNLAAFDFFESHIVKPLSPRAIVVGHDFAFGKSRLGNTDWLKAQCEQRGIELIVIEKVEVGEERVSSQRVREALKIGDIEKANILLGHPFFMRGEVETGDRRGSTLGFPTANLKIPKQLLVPFGVYATRVTGINFSARGITNIGVRPTFGPSRAKVETHILDGFNQNIYGQTLTLELLGFIRPEKKFAGLEELKSQILLDIQSIQRYS